MNFENILFVGDIHGKFGAFRRCFEEKNPSCIIQVGDFGYWDYYSDSYCSGVRSFNTNNIPIYWIDGNHENFHMINELKLTAPAPLIPISTPKFHNYFYVPRCTTLNINGYNILFIGGAASIDYKYRKDGVDWFSHYETISAADMYNLPDIDIDIVVSHTCPLEWKLDLLKAVRGSYSFKDPSEDALSHVLNKYHPKLWVHGHWHEYVTGFYPKTNTKWICFKDYIPNVEFKARPWNMFLHEIIDNTKG